MIGRSANTALRRQLARKWTLAGEPVADSNIWVSTGTQSAPIPNGGCQFNVTDDALVTLTATSTIRNPPPAVSAAHCTIESTPTLTPPVWTSRAPHTNLPGIDGNMTRSINLGGATSEFFRARNE